MPTTITHPTTTDSPSQATNQSFLDEDVNERVQSSKAWIAGAVAGPIVAVALLGVLLFMLHRRKKKGASSSKISKSPSPSKAPLEYYPPPPKVELSGSRPHKEKKKPTTVPELVGSSVIPMIPAVELDGNSAQPVDNDAARIR
jgi:hypothetical protein